MGFQYSPAFSALYASGAVICIAVFTKRNRMTFRKFGVALKNTTVVMMMMSVMLALAGVIVGCVQLTGLSFRLSMGLVNLAAGSSWVLLVLTAVTSILLGMGMTTAAVYVMLATLVAPALIQMGFLPLAAHFFIFYYGVAAMITPPVCPASYIAAGIANASPMQTALTGVRLSCVTFIVPLIFIFRPALLMVGSAGEILYAALVTVVIVLALAVGFTGYLARPIGFLRRALLFASVFLCIYPNPITDLLGMAIIAMALLTAALRVGNGPGASGGHRAHFFGKSKNAPARNVLPGTSAQTPL